MTEDEPKDDEADKLEDDWCFTFGIPEQILADGLKQYQSKLLDIINEYLDIRAFQTTTFHPSCNGQIERNVQTSKCLGENPNYPLISSSQMSRTL